MLVYSHVEQDTPAAVRISGAQALGARSVLITALHRNTLHLRRRERNITLIKVIEVNAVPDTDFSLYVPTDSN